MEGESAWPAPAQTVNDYLGDGDWSLGMLRTGICPAERLENRVVYRRRERYRGFCAEDSEPLLSYCARYDRDPTALNYGYWSTIPTLIEQVPPLGAVRAKFGSWQTTLHRGRTQIARKLRLWTKKDANATAVESGAAEASAAESSAAEGA